MHYELRRDDVRVVLDYENEGWFGDYDERHRRFALKNNKDERLLRFNVQQFLNDEWGDVDNACYCTGLPVDSPPEKIKEAAALIMWAVKPAVEAGISIKKACERLSWVGAHDDKRMHNQSRHGE